MRTGRHAGVAMTGIGIASAAAWVRHELTRLVLASGDADFPTSGVRRWSWNLSNAASPGRSTRGEGALISADLDASSFRRSGLAPTVTIKRGSPVNRDGDVVKVFLRSREKP